MSSTILLMALSLPGTEVPSGFLAADVQYEITFHGKLRTARGEAGSIRLEIISNGDKFRVAGGAITVGGATYRLQGLSFDPEGDRVAATFQLFPVHGPTGPRALGFGQVRLRFGDSGDAASGTLRINGLGDFAFNLHSVESEPGVDVPDAVIN
jgi:hypothetical protein